MVEITGDKDVFGDAVSLISFGIAIIGLSVLWSGAKIMPENMALVIGFGLTFVGATGVGGFPSINKILGKLEFSIQIFIFSIGLVVLFVQWKGFEYLIETAMAWILGGFISTGIVVFVKRTVKD